MYHTNDGKQNTPHPLDLSTRVKIPVVSGVSNVFHTTRLCERLVQPKSDFDLTDPNGYLLNFEYSSLHDPNLRSYLHRKDIHQRLITGGFITKDEKIICSIKELNRYRDHLAEVELDYARKFRKEQKELVWKFLTLQKQGKITDNVTMSDVTEWLLQRGKNIFFKQKQANRSSRLTANYGLEDECCLLRLPSIAMRSNMVSLACCPSSTCRSELVWNTKGRQMLEEVTKEVKREMRLEHRWVINKQEKEEMKRERQQKKMSLKGQRKERHFKTKTDPQDNPENLDNILISILDNAQVHPAASTSPRFSENQPLLSPVEPRGDKHSALCQNLLMAVTQKSIMSAHNLYTSDEGLVHSASSTLATCGSLFGHADSLQSITQQLTDIEQMLLEEHFKGTITTEELHTIMQDVVVTVVEEVNGILIPAIMAFEYERIMGSTSSSDITCSSISSSDCYQSSVSASMQSSSSQTLLSSTTPPMPFNRTIIIKQGTVTSPEEPEREVSPLSPPCLRSPRASLVLRVETIIQKVIKGAVDILEAEGDNSDESKMSPEQKAEKDSKSVDAASRDTKEISFRGMETTEDTMDIMYNMEAKEPTVEVKEEETISDGLANIEVKEVENIVDVMVKMNTQEAKANTCFEMESKLTKELEVNIEMGKQANIEVKTDTPGNIIAESDSRTLLIQTDGVVSKINIIDDHMDSQGDDKNAQAEMGWGGHESPKIFQSYEDDEDAYKGSPLISLLKSTTLSSDQVDEILDKVIDILTEERHEIIFAEDKPTSSSRLNPSVSAESRPSSEPLCCVSGGQEFHIQHPGEDTDPPCKLLGGQYSSLLMENDVSDGEIMPYANSIINIIMQKMKYDNDLYEPKRVKSYFLQSTSMVPVVYIPRTVDLRSRIGANPNSIRVVRWVLQTIQRRHGWLGQANVGGRQDAESRHLCELIQMLLEKLNHRYADTYSTGDMQAPTLSDVLQANDRCGNPPKTFKVMLQEATVEPISDILEHLSANVVRPKSCIVPTRKPFSPLIKSISLTNLRCRTLTSAVAIDISSSVVEKLTEASGFSKATSSMSNLRDFVRAMTNSHREHSQQISPGSNIDHVFKEILEMVINKLKGFISQGLSHKPREQLAEKMAESCHEVECAFMEILQTLKDYGTAVKACGTQAVDQLSTALSDTMFIHVCEGHPPQVNTKHAQSDSTAQCKPAKNKTDGQQNYTIKKSIMEIKEQLPHSILNVTSQKTAKDMPPPKICKHNVAIVPGLGSGQRCLMKAKMSKSSVHLLQTTVKKFVVKLMGERVSFPGGVSASFQQGKDQTKSANTKNLQRSLSPQIKFMMSRSEAPRQQRSRKCSPKNMKRDQMIGTISELMTQSVVSSLPVDSSFEVPASAVKASDAKHLSSGKLGEYQMLVPTPPPRYIITNGQRDENIHQDSQESKRRARSLRTLQAAKRVASSMTLDVPRPSICKKSGRKAGPVIGSYSLLNEPLTGLRSSVAPSNTSLAATEIIEDVVHKLLLGDSPDLISSSHTSPSPRMIP